MCFGILKIKKKFLFQVDQYNLNRFIEAQMVTYEGAMLELARSRKESHLLWYIFPQITDLVRSETTNLY
jgi:uncharacterized protein (DUF1810 family)